MLTVLIPVAVVALIVIIGVLAFQRGRDGFDLSGNTLVRAYLYLGSFAGVIALAFGLSLLLNGALASAVGNEFVYGGTPLYRPCPVGVDCPVPTVAVAQSEQAAIDRRRLEDLVRGGTFTIFGALFYGAHRWARRAIYPRNATYLVGDPGGLRRAYLLLGAVVFGIGAVALLPAGVYQVLANAILPRALEFYRPGVADTLTAGVVSLVLWLLYLRAVLRDARGGEWRSYGSGPTTPQGAPAPVGAPIGPDPRERYTGAEAQPPQEFRRDQFVRPGERIVRVGRPGDKPQGLG